MPRLPVFVQAQPGKHPVQDLPEPNCDAAIRNRIEYLKTKAESLYSFQICYVVLYEGFRHNVSILNSFAKTASQPGDAMRELQAFVSTRKQVMLIESELQQSLSALHAKARSFAGRLATLWARAFYRKTKRSAF